MNATHLKHRNTPQQERLICLTSSCQGLYAPQCTQAERAFLASDPVIGFTCVVAVNEVLHKTDSVRCESVDIEGAEGR